MVLRPTLSLPCILSRSIFSLLTSLFILNWKLDGRHTYFPFSMLLIVCVLRSLIIILVLTLYIYNIWKQIHTTFYHKNEKEINYNQFKIQNNKIMAMLFSFPFFFYPFESLLLWHSAFVKFWNHITYTIHAHWRITH